MKHILYLIGSLSRGGAETIVVNTLNSIYNKYPTIKISIFTTLEGNGILVNQLNKNIIYKHVDCSGINVFMGISTIKNYMKQNNVSVLHTHLFYSMIIGRVVKNSKTHLIETYHNMEYHPDSVYYSKWRVMLDRFTFRKKIHSLYVSEDVKASIAPSRSLNHSNAVINNFAGDEFKYNYKFKENNGLKLLAVGNLKNDKNYQYALKTLSLLKNTPITLDIYGEGFLRQEMGNYISKNNLNVQIMGNVEITTKVFNGYDAFLMTSFNEGMPISLLEAINFGIPCILPDHLPVMRQVAQNAGLYFSINDETALKILLLKIVNNKNILKYMSLETKKQSPIFSTDKHVNVLAEIYNIK